MAKEFIKELIKYNINDCPEFIYDNPLLDKEIAKHVSKSFIKIMCHERNPDQMQQFHEILRKFCTTEPTEHLHINGNVIEMLLNCYIVHTKEVNSENVTDQMLDAFLIRKIADMNLSSIFTKSVTSEFIRAVLNLKLHKIDKRLHNIIMKDIIHWNLDDTGVAFTRDSNTLEAVWNEYNLPAINDDISIKMKTKIEQDLLGMCCEILKIIILKLDDWLQTNDTFNYIIKICSDSPNCFQMCCSIINCIYIKTKFPSSMQDFIKIFVKNVKNKLNQEFLSNYYPTHLSHIVVLLDINIDNIQCRNTRRSYINKTLTHLKQLQTQCNNELIMLLSHYPQWMDYYLENVNGLDM